MFKVVLGGRLCEMCPNDISHRRIDARFCEECIKKRQREQVANCKLVRSKATDVRAASIPMEKRYCQESGCFKSLAGRWPSAKFCEAHGYKVRKPARDKLAHKTGEQKSKNNSRRKEARAKRRRLGLCTNCGETWATPGHITCETCRIIAKDKRAAYRTGVGA